MSDPGVPSHRAPNRRGIALLAPVLAVLLLCWPALLNGGAFFFPDTGTYLRSADAIFGELTGASTAWSDRRKLYDQDGAAPAKGAAPEPPATTQPARPAGEPVHPVLLGRSIYYGLAVFPFVALFGSIGAVILQSALAVLTIWLALAAFGTERTRIPARALVITALLAALTSLPFFVSMLMPDVFAGIAIALAVCAAVGWERLRRWERWILAVLMAFCALAHSSHVLILLSLAVVTAVIGLLTRRKVWAAPILMALAAACGIAGEQAFVYAVKHRLGEPPVRPPFLTARLIDDGPGYRLLTRKCPAIGLEACRFLDRMPRDSDIFLWSYNPREGVFSTESIAIQRELAKQDMRFAIETLRHDPLGVVGSSIGNVARQLVMTDFNNFNHAEAMGGEATWGAPEPIASEIRASRYASATMPVTFSRWANLAAAIAAAGFLLAVLLGRAARGVSVQVRAAAGLALAAFFLNASVTGAMSKPHDRYNVRVIWILPLAALAILSARSRRIELEPS